MPPTVPVPWLRRRTLLASAALLLPLPGLAAPYAVDGPARQRPLASRGNCLDLTAAGARLVAVGERGHVLLSDDQGARWRQATAVPTRATLTAVHATDAQRLWAVGHGGVVLKSDDAGEHWALAASRTEAADVLLAVRVQADGHGLAVGGFGTALATHDGGRSWTAGPLLEGEAGERHLNRILLTAAGTWLVLAEGGTVLRAAERRPDGGWRWEAVKTPYAGSLWCGTPLAGGGVLVGGMRGNALRSNDDGRSWQHQAVAGAGSLTGAALLADGRAVLVGVDGTVVQTDAQGGSPRLRRLDDRPTLTGVVPVAPARLALSSTAGLRLLDV